MKKRNLRWRRFQKRSQEQESGKKKLEGKGDVESYICSQWVTQAVAQRIYALEASKKRHSVARLMTPSRNQDVVMRTTLQLRAE